MKQVPENQPETIQPQQAQAEKPADKPSAKKKAPARSMGGAGKAAKGDVAGRAYASSAAPKPYAPGGMAPERMRSPTRSPAAYSADVSGTSAT